MFLGDFVSAFRKLFCWTFWNCYFLGPKLSNICNFIWFRLIKSCWYSQQLLGIFDLRKIQEFPSASCIRRLCEYYLRGRNSLRSSKTSWFSHLSFTLYHGTTNQFTKYWINCNREFIKDMIRETSQLDARWQLGHTLYRIQWGGLND